MTEKWFYINISFSCFGLCIINEKVARVVFAPDIVKRMVGKKEEIMKLFLLKHKAKVRELK